MRVTNGMTINNLLLNLNKNVARLDKLQYQAATGNKLQFPSDDPIVAGRALRFRTNVAETDQFIVNTGQASSWMQTSELAYKNVEQIILRVQELSVQAASDSYTTEDRKKITKEIEELLKEASSEVNVTYAGRYVFSGFRTDEPPVFTLDNKRSFNINQDFKMIDIQNTTAFIKDDTGTAPVLDATTVNRLMIPYSVNSPDSPNYDPNCQMSMNSITITYSDGTPPKTFAYPSDIEDKFIGDIGGGVMGEKAYYSTSENAYDMTGATKIRWLRDTGELLLPDNFMPNVNSKCTITANYNRNGFHQDDINPVNYFNCTETIKNPTTGADETRKYTMDNQLIKYELGTNNKVQINGLAKDFFTPQFFSDLRDIVNFCNSATELSAKEINAKFPNMTSDEVNKYQEKELATYRDGLHKRFSNFLTKMDSHLVTYSKEYTELGARMNRIDFIENRLKDDRLNFISLRDDNELVDTAETMINLSNAAAVYQSALSTGSNIIQKSLVDFI